MSVFGIGYLTAFSEVIVVITALIADFIPIINENIYIVILLSICFVILYHKRIDLLNGKPKPVISKAVGVWIAMFSPIIQYSYEWLIIGSTVYLLFSYRKIFRLRIFLSGSLTILINDVLTGLASAAALHAVNAGNRILPFFLKFME